MISISIIIPVYNVEQYVRRCIESVMAQNTAEAEMECIIVDDCGTDRSMDVAEETVRNYSGTISFRILHHERNRGLSVARNTGLSHAKGQYVLFIDSDDYLMPGAIQYFVESMRLFPEVDMVVGNAKDMKCDSLILHKLEAPCLLTDPSDFFTQMLNGRIQVYAWNKLIRRSVLVDNQITFIEGIYYEDQSWTYQLFEHLNSVLLLPRPTYFYEYNEASIIRTSFSKERAAKVVWSYAVSADCLLNHPPTPQRYRKNMTVDYLLFMAKFLFNGVDVYLRCDIPTATAKQFRAVRWRLLRRSLRYGRLLTASFLLLLFRPFSYVQKLAFFRHHCSGMESLINRMGHLTDFLHRKSHV